jgi:hypothetical protein
MSKEREKGREEKVLMKRELTTKKETIAIVIQRKCDDIKFL